MDDSQFDGLGSLIRMSGVNVPSRARFVGETMVYSTLGSLTFGLVCGQVGANILTTGPLVPFLFGSWAGYSLGLAIHWQGAKRLALHYAEQYPRLLAHALWTERLIHVPPTIVQATEEKKLMQKEQEEQGDYDSSRKSNIDSGGPMTFDKWICSDGMGRLTWAILAAQSCKGDVEEIQRQQRQRIVDEHAEKLE